MAGPLYARYWDRGDLLTARQLNEGGHAANLANRWSVSGDGVEYSTSPAGHSLHIRNRESSTGDILAVHITAWNSGSSTYDWEEVERNAGDTAWSAISNGRTDEDFAKARHFNLWESLPATSGNPIFALLTLLVDVDGDYTPFFDVPVQRDGTFAHRTNLSSSPTAGNRKDLTMTEAELNTEEASSDLDWSTEGQGDKQGVVYTVPSRGIVYNGSGDATIYGYVTDIELDVMGRVVSRSEEMRYTIHTPAAC